MKGEKYEDYPNSGRQPTDDTDRDPDFHFQDLYHNECMYSYPDFFNNYEESQSDGSLHMLHLNILSLPCNQDSLIDMLDTYVERLHIICLTETWLNQRSADIYNINGCKAINNFRKKKRGGGVSILVKNNIVYQPLKKLLKMTTDIETLFIKINKSYTKTDRDVIVGVCYRPPSGNVTTFNLQLCEILNSINHDKHYIYLHGDFNLNLFSLNKSSPAQNFYNLVQTFSLYPLYNKATRIIGNSYSLIDNIFTNNLKHRHKNLIIISDISDHFPLLTISSEILDKRANPLEIRRIFNTKNLSTFCNLCPSDTIAEILRIDNPQQAYSALNEKMNDTFEKCFQPKTIKKKYFNRLPWLTAELKVEIKIKNKLFQY